MSRTMKEGKDSYGNEYNKFFNIKLNFSAHSVMKQGNVAV